MRTTRTVTIVPDAQGLPQSLKRPAFLLKVVRGPDKRREKRSAQGRLLLGSGEGADFALNDPTVSAVHCEIISDALGFRVRDVGAKNGVRVGDRRIIEAWLEDEEDLVLGDTVVRFKVLDEDDESPLHKQASFGKLRGASSRMRTLYSELARAAQSDAAVLLSGETGSGKELAADALVTAGPRRDKPLVVVDCGRLPPTLAESELFGHEAGAFTGAASRHVGAFERAHGGTIFLDEIGELPMLLQAKLLGVLERRQVTRVGGSDVVPVDVRVVAATHRDLAREVNRGTFRSDLYYRLAVVEIRVPSLRERTEDIPELVAHFLSEIPGSPGVKPDVLQRLYNADYPGNVRELRNAVERAALGLEDGPLPAVAQGAAVDTEQPYRLLKERLVASFERAYFGKLLEETKGNVSEAARRSGMNRVYLQGVVQRLKLAGRG